MTTAADKEDPKKGSSIAGIVTADEKGKSITVKADGDDEPVKYVVPEGTGKKVLVMGWQPPGKAARRAFAEEFAHQQPQVRRTRVHDQPLENIFPAAQMHASHPAAIIQVLIPSFQLLAALP